MFTNVSKKGQRSYKAMRYRSDRCVETFSESKKVEPVPSLGRDRGKRKSLEFDNDLPCSVLLSLFYSQVQSVTYRCLVS